MKKNCNIIAVLNEPSQSGYNYLQFGFTGSLETNFNCCGAIKKECNWKMLLCYTLLTIFLINTFGNLVGVKEASCVLN